MTLTESQIYLLNSIRASVSTGYDEFPIWMDGTFPREESAEYLGWNTADRPDLMNGFIFTSKGENAVDVEVDLTPVGGWEYVLPLPKGSVVGIGTPHSGTHYLSTILGWHHERYFFPLRKEEIEYEPEVSWMAAPFVDPVDTFIIHVVRDPLKVISSLQYRQWLNTKTDYAAQLAFDHTGTRDPVEFYIRWFWTCHEKAHATIRLEDIAHLSEKTNASFGNVPQMTYSDIPMSLRMGLRDIAEINNYRSLNE